MGKLSSHLLSNAISVITFMLVLFLMSFYSLHLLPYFCIFISCNLFLQSFLHLFGLSFFTMTDNQYSYGEMSNKMIRSDRRLQDVRSTDDPSSNPTSLAGKISIKDMGSKYIGDKESTEPRKKTAFHTNYSYSSSIESIGYHPTTEESAHMFDLIMVKVAQLLPDTSHEVVLSAADAILDTLKREMGMSEKRKEIGELLGFDIDNDVMHELVSLANRITDYEVGEQKNETERELAVIFDDEDEGEDAEDPVLDEEVGHEQEAEPEDQVVSESTTIIKTDASSGPKLLSIKEVDAFFLQRKLKELYNDESTVKRFNTELLRLLADENLEIRELENEMMELLDYENFDLIQMLIENRWTVVFGIQGEMSKGEAAQAELEAKMNRVGYKQEPRETKRPRDEESEVMVKKSKPSERPPQIIDLDALKFDQGSHLMTTSKVRLPTGSHQQTKKLYDIITVPAPAPLAVADDLVPISQLPQWCAAAFATTTTLNVIQSRVFPQAFGSDNNLLMCAPTGAGKTNVAMLTVLRVLDAHMRSGRLALNEFKIVYIAPLKALVQEQVREFSTRLASFGIVVNELTGDASLSKQQILETHILVTTPEKWDVITRKPNEHVAKVRLVIIDEVHLLHDVRGPVLESIVSRTSRQGARMVGLSATLPNYKDVAQFLHVAPEALFYFDALYRPCPLEQQFIGIKERTAIKRRNAANEACLEKVVETLDNNHQLIVFVHSRKDTYKTAAWLQSQGKREEKEGSTDGFVNLSTGSANILLLEAEKMKNRQLQEIIPSGIGIHHAGLSKDERLVVEDLFAQGHLRVLVSTATLAWGVNLPAHTVIIKGTETYLPESGSWEQLSPQDILQMLGRAGRPRYDVCGEGVIITSHDELQYYLAVLNQQLPIESHMMSRLADSLNAEVVAGSVRSRSDAVDWIASTYLYVRMLRAPAIYHVGAGDDDEVLTNRRTDMAHSALTVLLRAQMVDYDEVLGTVAPTELGKIASHYYINHDSMHMYHTRMRPWFSEMDVLRVFAQSEEFRHVPVRQEEKMEVSRLMERCPYPVKESAHEGIAKVNVLLQTYILRLELEGFALMADMVYITQSAGRLLRALFEIAMRKRWSGLAKRVHNLCLMVERRQWMASSPLRQFGLDVPREVIRATEASHLPWSRYFDLSAAELAEALNLRGSSQTAYEWMQRFPRLELSYLCQPVAPGLMRIQIEVMPQWVWLAAERNSEMFMVLVEDVDGERLLHDEIFTVQRRHNGKEHVVEFYVAVTDPPQPHYFVSFVSTRWLHCTWTVAVNLRRVAMPKKFPAGTELTATERRVDEVFGERAAFADCDLAAFFDETMLNAFQVQCMPLLFHTDENTFVGVPKGADATVFAEMAILRHWNHGRGRVVYVHPDQDHVDRLTSIWAKKFVGAGKLVAKLEGTGSDSSIIGENHLVLATVMQLAVLAKRWRQRKVLRAVELLIADDVHFVGTTAAGSEYEVMLTRMRLVAAQLETQMRVVALAQPVASGRDLGEWLGAARAHVYNFAPRTRPVGEIRIEGFECEGPATEEMIAVASTAIGARSLVFVANRKEAVRMAVRLAASKEEKEEKEMEKLGWNEQKKLGWKEENQDLTSKEDSKKEDKPDNLKEDEDVSSLTLLVSDPHIRELLGQGVGVLDATMSLVDRKVVERLFAAGRLSVVVASRNYCARAPRAPQVIVVGNSEYDAKEKRYADYRVDEMGEMIGCTNMLTSSQCILLVAKNKVGFYSRFAADAMPVESSLNLSLADYMTNEIASRNFKSKQDIVDWLTFTYFYRRLQHNPGFYEATDVSALGISEYLSEMIETTLGEMQEVDMVEVDDDDTVLPLNNTVIAAHHNVAFLTMKNLLRLSNRTRIRAMMDVVAAASEFAALPVRRDDEAVLRRIYAQVPIKVDSEDYDSPHFKAHVLLQAHLSRIALSPEMRRDQQEVLRGVLSIVFAGVDVLASEGHLNAIQMMELLQMVVQGVWNNRDAPLKQIPHFTDAMLARCRKHEVETVYDIMALEDDVRDEILQLDEDNEEDAAKLNAIAEFVNKYPNVDIKYELDATPAVVNEPKAIVITLERDEEAEDLAVESARYAFAKQESWWVVIGDSETRQLYAIKKATIAQETQDVAMEFSVPTAGTHNLTAWCMCDSYIDADKEVSFEVVVEEE